MIVDDTGGLRSKFAFMAEFETARFTFSDIARITDRLKAAYGPSKWLWDNWRGEYVLETGARWAASFNQTGHMHAIYSDESEIIAFAKLFQ